MNISALHLCTSDSWGGLELYVCRLMAELQKAGCAVFAICKPKSKVEAFLIQEGIRFTYLPSYAKVSLASVRFLQSLIRRHNIQVLHTHFHKDIWPASLALRSDRERKLFLTIHLSVPKKKDIFHRYIYSRLNGIFTSSPELHAHLPQLYPVPRSKVHFLPLGINISRYQRQEMKRAAIRAQYGVQSDEVLIGTAVRIDPGKGVLDFVRSFLFIDERLCTKVKFMIVGEPTRRGHGKQNESPYEPHCENYLEQIRDFIAEHSLSERILLTGFQDDVIGYMSAFDVFVFPSRDEFYSLVVLEAMSMALPVVAARAGGNIYQVIEGVNGLFYDVASCEDLAKKLEVYLRQPHLQREHGNGARNFVKEKHNMDSTLQLLMDFYSH